MNPEEKLSSLGYSVPSASVPVASYIPCVRTGNLLFVSGQLPMKEGGLTAEGKIGSVVSTEQAREAVVTCLLNGLAAVRNECGSLKQVKRIVQVTCYFNTEGDFSEHSSLLNAASDLLFEVFGEKGRHSRLALGAFTLPKNAACELSLIVEVL